MPIYHATVTCSGLTEAEAVNAPAAIVEEFAHRPWHSNVKCWWNGQLLWLEAHNDYDADGKALLDEFGDAVVACVPASGTIGFEVDSVKPSHV